MNEIKDIKKGWKGVRGVIGTDLCVDVYRWVGQGVRGGFFFFGGGVYKRKWD